MKTPISLSYQELDGLIFLIKKIHDFDFSLYSKASLKRRFEHLLMKNQWDLFDIKTKLTNQTGLLDYIIREITVNVTEMFRDPEFFNSVKSNVIPYLSSYQRVKVWIAGASTGEELYSFSTLFDEQNINKKAFFYGTDINTKVLEQAKEGIYSIQKIKTFAQNYSKTSIETPFSDLFHIQGEIGIVNKRLRENNLFSIHNLVSDGVFNEFQMISCRNVLIYFEQELQIRVLQLFIDSLCQFGFLCLGSKEVIRSNEILDKLKIIDRKLNIYQKVK